MRITRKILQAVIGVIFLFLIYISSVIIYGTIDNYKPDHIINVEPIGNGMVFPDSTQSFSILSWNIGYCGLGAEMDFFYDGGKQVKTPKNLVRKYAKGISNLLNEHKDFDFYFFQEVDSFAWRSNKTNQIELLHSVFPHYQYSYVPNYNSFFIPIPITNPLGKVASGLVNFSKYNCISSERFAYHSSYPWPKNVFMLDRCFLVNKYPLQNGKQLIIINTHNSAFDSGGKLKEVEMQTIRDFMISEYKKGNFVVAGGDWNQNPVGFLKNNIAPTFVTHEVLPIKPGLFPGTWQFVYDPSKPTNRKVHISWDPLCTSTSIIDFFIVSPNIQIDEIKTLSENFQNSDHEPISIEFSLILN